MPRFLLRLCLALVLAASAPAQAAGTTVGARLANVCGVAFIRVARLLHDAFGHEDEPVTYHVPQRKEPDQRAKEFVARLQQQGLSGLTFNEEGKPCIWSADRYVEIPIFSGAVPDMALGLEATPGKDHALHQFALAHDAIMFRNWQVARAPHDFKPLLDFPQTVTTAFERLGEQMDWAIVAGRRIHFNLEGVKVEEALATFTDVVNGKMDPVRTKNTNWELCRTAHAILTGKYPRRQVIFYDGKRKLSDEEVDKLLKKFADVSAGPPAQPRR